LLIGYIKVNSHSRSIFVVDLPGKVHRTKLFSSLFLLLKCRNTKKKRAEKRNTSTQIVKKENKNKTLSCKQAKNCCLPLWQAMVVVILIALLCAECGWQ